MDESKPEFKDELKPAVVVVTPAAPAGASAEQEAEQQQPGEGAVAVVIKPKCWYKSPAVWTLVGVGAVAVVGIALLLRLIWKRRHEGDEHRHRRHSRSPRRRRHSRTRRHGSEEEESDSESSSSESSSSDDEEEEENVVCEDKVATTTAASNMTEAEGVTISAASKAQFAEVINTRPHHRISGSVNAETTLVAGTVTSSNWAGYAAATNLTRPVTNSATMVQGTVIVPALTLPVSSRFGSTPPSYAAHWVGIDGFEASDPSVQQIGLLQEAIAAQGRQPGRQTNLIFFEMYPGPLYTLNGFPVNIGDTLHFQVTYTGGTNYVLVATNVTRSVTFTIPSNYTQSRSAVNGTAEWITEAPASGSKVLPLAQFAAPVHWSNCTATIGGNTGPINDAFWLNDEIIMEANHNTIKATPSALSNAGQNFTVSWSHS